jgi:hypothetical protein
LEKLKMAEYATAYPQLHRQSPVTAQQVAAIVHRRSWPTCEHFPLCDHSDDSSANHVPAGVPVELPAGDDADPFERAVARVYDTAMELLLAKHRDYGPHNIGRSPGGALNGLRVRMHDKLARINNLIDTGSEPNHESVRDSFVDLLNYSAIALLVLDGEWPSE